MAVVPVFCDNCGTLFGTENLLGDDWRSVTFKDVGFGPCPVCGATGRVLDGTYDFIGDAIRVLSAPTWSQEKLGWLAARIRAAQAGAVSAERVVEEVSAEAPDLGAAIATIMRSGWKAIQVLVAILAILTYAQLQLNPAADDAAITKSTDRIVQAIREHPLVGSPALSTARPVGPSHNRTSVAKVGPKRKPRPPRTYGKNKRKKRK